MNIRLSAAVCAAALSVGTLGLSAAAFAQAPPTATEVSADKLALTMFPAKDKKPLKVTTPAFKDGADIPYENTQYRTNTFPGLEWSKGPKGTQSYVLIMQDPDGSFKGDAILHWTMINIPTSTTKLDAGATAPPPGAMYGPNVRGPMHAYMGPKTPAGPKHRYHLQIFALDTILQGDPNLTWDGLKAAVSGHVLASGQVIGLGSIDPDAPKPAPKP